MELPERSDTAAIPGSFVSSSARNNAIEARTVENGVEAKTAAPSTIDIMMAPEDMQREF